MLVASIMEEVNRAAWEEIVERCQEAGADAFEINFRYGQERKEGWGREQWREVHLVPVPGTDGHSG